MSRIRERNRASASGDRRFTNETHGEKKMGRHLEGVSQDFFRNRSKEASKTIGLFQRKKFFARKKFICYIRKTIINKLNSKMIVKMCNTASHPVYCTHINWQNLIHWHLFMPNFAFYRLQLRFRKAGRYGVVAHKRFTEPRVTMKWLLAKPRSLSNHPAFKDLNGR